MNPDFEKYSIHRWWRNHLDSLIEESGLPLKTLSEKLFAIEYFPYFPKTSDVVNSIPILESQRHAFSLVENAIKSKKMIVTLNKRLRNQT